MTWGDILLMFVLFLGIIFLIIISFILGEKDIVNPIFLCCAGFFLSIICAYYNVTTWGINLCNETVMLIFFSLLVMVIVSFLVINLTGNICNKYARPGKKISGPEAVSYIEVDTYKYVLVILLAVFTAGMYIRDIITITKSSGYISGAGIQALMRVYRLATHFKEAEGSNRISRYTVYSMDLLRAFAYICTYIGINNILTADSRRKQIRNLRNFVIAFLFCVVNLLTGSRMQILKLVIFFAVVYLILQKRKNGWDKTVKLSTVLKIGGLVVLALILFVQIRGLVGRETDTDPLYYITSYAGGSIEGLDLFIKEPIEKSALWGKESFYAMYNYLGKWFDFNGESFLFAKEFRRSNGVGVGNIYTALRCFYYDFGFWGCLACCGIVSAVFSLVYAFIRFKPSDQPVDMKLLLYGYFSYTYVMFCINYYFDYLTPAIVKMLICFFVGRWFMTKFKAEFS